MNDVYLCHPEHPQNYCSRTVVHGVFDVDLLENFGLTSVAGKTFRQIKRALIVSFFASSCLIGGRGHLSAPPSDSDGWIVSDSLQTTEGRGKTHQHCHPPPPSVSREHGQMTAEMLELKMIPEG
jgi:hypothetical protein